MENDNLAQVPSNEEPALPAASANAVVITDEETPVKVEQPNDDGINHTRSAYAANPLTYSIGFILFLDFMERFAFNGVIFTMPGYLTGYYEPHWNPNFALFQANSYIATSQGIGFVTPFIAAFTADCLIGDYWSINLFTGLCYIPGILIIAISSIPHSEENVDFPLKQLKLGTHILFPLGFVSLSSISFDCPIAFLTQNNSQCRLLSEGCRKDIVWRIRSKTI